MADDYDLIVIGAGVAGMAAANKCAAEGWRVAITDPLPFGGTCALRGCDPKKILRRGAEVVDDAWLMREKGVDDADIAIDWPQLMAHKRGFTDAMPAKVEQGLIDNGVELFHAAARFTGPDEVEIDGTRYTSKHFLIATGATPRPLEFPGHEHVVDSTAFLDLPELPERILFIGGGYISFEFAHIASRAGADCAILDRHDRPLRGFDGELVERLVERSEGAGIRLLRTTDVVSIEVASDGAMTVTIEQDGEQTTMEADLVVHGAGRVANLAPLDLDAAGVEWGPKGVQVEPHLQSTSNPRVFAAGDSADTEGKPLTPVATAEGSVAASNMLKGGRRAPDYTGEPSIVFTVPELCRVGMLEDEAREAGHDVVVRSLDTSEWYSNYRVGETTSAVKVLIDRESDRILGAHLLGPSYAELVNVFALAIQLGLTTKQLRSARMGYPTVGSDLASML